MPTSLQIYISALKADKLVIYDVKNRESLYLDFDTYRVTQKSTPV